MLSALLALALSDLCQPAVTDDAGVLSLTSDAGNLLALDASIAGNPEWTAAVYESLFDTSTLASVDAVSWSALRPSGLPLPDDGGVDAFPLDAVDMRQNVLLLHFEEPVWVGAPAEVRDSSGLGHHGTTDGGSTHASGLPGNAASFDGDACLTVDDTPALRPTTGLTVSAWFYPRRVDGSAQGIASKRFDYADRSAWALFLWSNEHLFVDLDMEDDRHEGNIVITQDRWHHAALVFDGSQPAATRARLYVDGVLDSEFQETSASLPAFDPPMTVGCLPNPAASLKQGFFGKIDELAVMHRAFSQAEIEALYRRGASRVLGRVRGCADASCSTMPPWLGPGGAPDTFFTGGGGPISLGSPGWVQVQLMLVGDGSGAGWPEVRDITVSGVRATSCDAGAPASDAGSEAGPHSLRVGCGCEGFPFSPLLLVLLAWRRSRQGSRAISPSPGFSQRRLSKPSSS